MHNIEHEGGWSSNFNSDFSGDAIIYDPDGNPFTIPCYVLAELVAEYVRSSRISALESASPREILK